MSEWTAIIDDLIDHVNLLKELGERSAEVDPSLLQALAAAPKASAAAQQARAPSPAAPEPAPSRPLAPSGKPAAVPIPTGTEPPLPPEERRRRLDEIAVRVDACEACVLRRNRTRSVPGQGNPNSPDVMFIGEAPGADEDQQGLAFVGAAGQFLTKMIEAMGYTRDDVFIANICKCRPPNNRTPLPEEMQTCLPFLREQIRIIRPKTIVLLGGTAIKGLLDTQVGVTRMQGQWTKYDGIPVMPTFHPAYILRFESFGNVDELKTAKMQVWKALKLVLAQLGRPVPGAKAT